MKKITMEKEPSKYFRFHYRALRILGMGMYHHPEENNFDNYPTRLYSLYAFLCTIINIIGYTTSETMFATKVWRDKRDSSLVFLAFTMVGVHVFATIKILILIKNNKKIQKIIKVLEVDTKRFKQDPEILKRSFFLTKVVTGCFFIMGELTITLMSLYSIIVDYDRKGRLKESNYTIEIPRDTPFTAYIPWDTREDLHYAAGFVYCVFGMYWMGSTLIICDTMIASIMAHISGQFQMVQKVVVDIGDDAVDMLLSRLGTDKGKIMTEDKKMYGESDGKRCSKKNNRGTDDLACKKRKLMHFFTEDDFNDAMICCLKQAIKYHQLIIEITKDLQDAYSHAFLCQTASSFYVIGLILVQTAKDVSNIYSLRFFNTLGFLFSILWQLFSQTYSANEITLQAAKVSESAYSAKWYEIGVKGGQVSRMILILQHNAQRPLYLTAGKFAPMSNKLFVSIIRNAYSIFTLITTVMSGEK